MKGVEYNPGHKIEIPRYTSVKNISSQFYDLIKSTDSKLISLEKEVIEDWCSDLYDKAKMGLEHNPNSYDIKRYSNILEIQEDLKSTINASEEDYSDLAIESKKSTKEKREDLHIDFLADREIADEMVKMIGRAEKQILIASPWIWGSEEIISALKSVNDKKGVGVKILTRTAEENGDEKHIFNITALYQCGFQIEHDFKVHSKMLLIDDKELLIGSANLVGTSLTRNYEMAIWTDKPETVMEAKMYFTDLMGEIFLKKLNKKVVDK